MAEQNELPPEIIRDDIEALREEADPYFSKYEECIAPLHSFKPITKHQSQLAAIMHRKFQVIMWEVVQRIAQAKHRGIEVSQVKHRGFDEEC